MELISTYLEQILIAVFIVINAVSFFVVVHDKRKAISGHSTERTPEGILFFMAAIFGGTGVYLGMLVFRHKTRKWYFQLDIPLFILQNLAIAWMVFDFIK